MAASEYLLLATDQRGQRLATPFQLDKILVVPIRGLHGQVKAIKPIELDSHILGPTSHHDSSYHSPR